MYKRQDIYCSRSSTVVVAVNVVPTIFSPAPSLISFSGATSLDRRSKWGEKIALELYGEISRS